MDPAIGRFTTMDPLAEKYYSISVKSYGTNDVHKPAHAHVKGGGKEVRIGPNGKTLDGQPELSTKQRNVVKKQH
ncbi:DUF4160 domain-containing protein [Bacteroides sp. 519]|uniref:DUF4160 domain-containing protein n=1 Tax=Bacteroides sp. 519 TaxID=2302937 RepID=UPI0013D8505D|nr:DUF4160 domain-containing protein [Bacteroides sp. 519]NDV59045.1 hypothetical protein [Bacteroides sp. 519]